MSLTFDVAGIGSRFLAAAIDFVILIATLIALGLGCLALFLLGGSAWGSPALIILLTGYFLASWGYFIFFETVWAGQTPGKRRLGLRVVKTSGLPVGFTEALVRNLLRVVDALPTLYGVGVVIMFVNPQSRRLGDLAAGTLVVREPVAVRLQELVQEVEQISPPSAPAFQEQSWDVRLLSRDHRHIAHELLDRAPGLRPEARRRVGDKLAAQVAAEIGAAAPSDPEAFLRRVLDLVREEEDSRAAG